MRSYNRDSRSGRRDGGRDFRRRDSGTREMHKAVCSQCGKECEVPFKPSSGKPIYCRDCFEGKEGGDSRSPRRNNSNKELLEQLGSLNTKLDKVLELLEPKVKKSE